MKSLGSKAKIGNLDHTPAPIVLLFGTSSAGKGAVIDEVKEQSKGDLDYQVEGIDTEVRKHPRELDMSLLTNQKMVMESIFAKAVEHSKQGKPTILDVGPIGDYDVISGYNEYMKENNPSCPSIVALAHCDFGKLVEHVDKRNAESKSGEARKGFFRFNQYAKVGHLEQDGETQIGELTPEEIFNAAAKFGGSVEDAKTLLSNLGIAEDVDPKKPVKITTNLPHDLLLQTDPKDAERESGVDSPKAIKESARLINEAVKGRSISNAADLMPKYKALSVVERVDLDSAAEIRDTPFPIASISKSFCGAVCALMAVDGKFGKKGIDATLQEVLENAKLQHPERAEKIDEYQEMLERRGFSDVKISELLTHQSGCRDADYLAPSSCSDLSPLEFFSDHLGRGGCERGQYRYSNVGYTLIEEIVNLASDKGGYKQELQERVFAKLELTNTGLLEDSLDPKSHEAGLHLGQAVFIPGSKESPHSDKIVLTHTEFPANHTTPLGAVHASCGGLYSSVSDLQKFSEELGKMVIGQENSLTYNPEAVSKLYRQQLSDSRHYSLGVEFEKGAECVMKHTGLFPGNFASMAVLMPCSFDHLKSDAVIELGADEKLKTNIFMQKFDYTVSSHFTEKAEAIPTAMLKEFVNSRLDEAERERFSDARSDEIEKYLIENDRMPKDFAIIRKEIFDAFKPAGEKVKAFLIENYLNKDGVIDSAKIAADFETTEDVDKAIGPMFVESREIATGILSKLHESLTKSELANASEAILEPMQMSFVEKLCLQKPEQQKSFVERMRGGKDGGKSRDGHNEL